jgi:hypothetical protein
MRLVSNGPQKGIAYEPEVAFLNPNVETALRNRIFLKQSFNILQVPKIWMAYLQMNIYKSKDSILKSNLI